jgi:hypothetical protein
MTEKKGEFVHHIFTLKERNSAPTELDTSAHYLSFGFVVDGLSAI